MSLNQKFNLNKIFKGLVSYAIECQDNAERYQPLNAPPWSEMRRQWINGILCGMAELNGEDLDSDYLERIDHCLDQRQHRGHSDHLQQCADQGEEENQKCQRTLSSVKRMKYFIY